MEPIRWFADLGLADRPAVGGKAASLGELTRAGIPVPAGFVVLTSAFEEFIAVVEHSTPVRRRVAAVDADDLPAIQAVSAAVQGAMLAHPLPRRLREALHAARATLLAEAVPLADEKPQADGTPLANEMPQAGDGTAAVAVRSSATAEDSADASFAGLQDTLLWILTPDALERALLQCWASLYSVPSISYRLRRSMPEEEVAMAVVVQKMVDARKAGVMFTRSPASGDRSVIVVEGAWGLGSAVVSGEVTPDRFVIAKITGEITVREIRDKHCMHRPREGGGTVEVPTPADLQQQPCLEDAELAALRELGRRIERHYGCPQDIEWAFDQRGRLHVLQSRPETVWAARDAAPVSRALENPLQHVMNVFGGKR